MQMIPVNSSNIHSIGYDYATGRHRIRFRDRTRKDGTIVPGGLYEAEIPPEAHEALLAADSHGTHFGRYMRTVFTYRKVEEE